MKIFKAIGDIVNYVTSGAVVSGAAIAIGRLLGILVNDIAASGTGPLRVKGVVTVTKDGTYAWTQGQEIFWDATNSRFTSAYTGVHAGLAYAAAGASETSGDLILNEGFLGGVENAITDPGDAGAIPVTASGHVLLVSAAAETRTLAAPLAVGQHLRMIFKTDGGDIVLTCSTGLDAGTGRTTYRFQNAGEFLELAACQSGNNIRWRIIGGDLGVANVIPDPGTGAAIPVERSGTVAITTAGAETNTLAIPTFKGQRLTLIDDTHVGNRVITSAQAVNQAGNTTLTFGAAADFCELVATTVGGALRWRVAANDGVALS